MVLYCLLHFIAPLTHLLRLIYPSQGEEEDSQTVGSPGSRNE